MEKDLAYRTYVCYNEIEQMFLIFCRSDAYGINTGYF